VPQKLQLAWQYRSGQAEVAKEKTTTSSAFLFSITTPFGGPIPNDEVNCRFVFEAGRYLDQKGLINCHSVPSQDFSAVDAS
jgi:hypothetical protein